MITLPLAYAVAILCTVNVSTQPRCRKDVTRCAQKQAMGYRDARHEEGKRVHAGPNKSVPQWNPEYYVEQCYEKTQ